jgi:Protein of unknown function (DUF2721)
MPGFGLTELSPLDSVAHVIQVALTPIFLLSGIAALLNVFSTRLARVADRVDLVSQLIEKSGHEPSQPLSAQLTYLRRRSRALDVAVVLGVFAGVATCAATLVLFIGALRDSTLASLLFALFGLAILSTLGALIAFVLEMLMASRGLRAEVAQRRRSAEEDSSDIPTTDEVATQADHVTTPSP